MDVLLFIDHLFHRQLSSETYELLLKLNTIGSKKAVGDKGRGGLW